MTILPDVRHRSTTGNREGQKMRWIRVSLTYVGAIVGAGFASGQEIYQFFTRYGPWGMFGIALAGLLFFGIGWRAMEVGRRRGGGAGKISPLAEGVTLGFLVLGLGVVITGGGAAIHQLVGLPRWVGAICSLGLMMVVVFRGVQTVMWVNTLVVPYLMLSIILVATIYVPRGTFPTREIPWSTHWWALSASLYVSYNIFTAILVLFTLGGSLPSRCETGLAALLGATVLTGLALLEHRVLLDLRMVRDLPLLDTAVRIHPLLGALFGVGLWLALLTTGIAEIFAVVERVGRSRALGLVGVLPLSFVGFQGMVATLYPLMGGLAVLIWGPLLRLKQDH